MKKAAMAGALGFGLLIALLLSMFLIIASDEDSGGSGSGLYIGVNLSPEVLAHQPMEPSLSAFVTNSAKYLHPCLILSSVPSVFTGSPADSEDCITSSSVPPDST